MKATLESFFFKFGHMYRNNSSVSIQIQIQDRYAIYMQIIYAIKMVID